MTGIGIPRLFTGTDRHFPGAPLTYFNDGGGGGGVSSDFFGSEILAQRDFLGLCKMTEFFWVAKRKQGFFGVAKKELRDFFVYANKSSDFLGRQIS